jgi:hypothetical protein
MHLGHLRAPHRDRDGVPPRVAGVGIRRRMISLGAGVVVVLGYRRMMVLVRGWAVVMVRVIVSDVLMYVESRPRGRRRDQRLNEQTCDDPAHEDSLLRRPVELGRRRDSHVEAVLACSDECCDTARYPHLLWALRAAEPDVDWLAQRDWWWSLSLHPDGRGCLLPRRRAGGVTERRPLSGVFRTHGWRPASRPRSHRPARQRSSPWMSRCRNCPEW